MELLFSLKAEKQKNFLRFSSTMKGTGFQLIKSRFACWKTVKSIPQKITAVPFSIDWSKHLHLITWNRLWNPLMGKCAYIQSCLPAITMTISEDRLSCFKGIIWGNIHGLKLHVLLCGRRWRRRIAEKIFPFCSINTSSLSPYKSVNTSKQKSDVPLLYIRFLFLTFLTSNFIPILISLLTQWKFKHR